MAQKKKKNERLVTPQGTASFPYLNTPDTKFNDAGEYKVDLIVPEADAKEFTSKIEEMTEAHWNEVYNQAKAKDKKRLSKHYPYEEVLDEETEEPTGKIKIKCKCNATLTKDDGTVVNLAPKLFDKYGKEVPDNKLVRYGSTIRCNVECVPYKVDSSGQVGISLRLKAVQVLKFQEGGTAENYGFGVEEAPEEDDDYGFNSSEEAPHPAESEDGDF